MTTPVIAAFYDELRAETHLQRLIDDKVREGIHLEFKKKKHASTGRLDDSDGRQFSRALSGFGNSDGGILLWSIESGPNDEAVALRPITAVHEFRGALQKSILNSTQPVVDGVMNGSLGSGPHSGRTYSE